MILQLRQVFCLGMHGRGNKANLQLELDEERVASCIKAKQVEIL